LNPMNAHHNETSQEKDNHALSCPIRRRRSNPLIVLTRGESESCKWRPRAGACPAVSAKGFIRLHAAHTTPTLAALAGSDRCCPRLVSSSSRWPGMRSGESEFPAHRTTTTVRDRKQVIGNQPLTICAGVRECSFVTLPRLESPILGPGPGVNRSGAINFGRALTPYKKVRMPHSEGWPPFFGRRHRNRAPARSTRYQKGSRTPWKIFRLEQALCDTGLAGFFPRSAPLGLPGNQNALAVGTCTQDRALWKFST
jgi:hypothetical protein